VNIKEQIKTARRLAEIVEREGRPMALVDVKVRAMPRASWDFFLDVLAVGYLEGILRLGDKAQGGVDLEVNGQKFYTVEPRGNE
jgi:hypothetical protein